MAYSTSHHLGININYVGAKPWYDINGSTMSPAVGSKVAGNDGHTYVLVTASAGIAPSTAIVITEPAMTAAGGAGAYSTQGTAVLTGQFFWARSNAL